jgi:two-component system LytT family sensor kinase
MSRKTVVIIHVSFWLLFIGLGILLNVAEHHNLQVTPALYWQDLMHPFTWIGYGRTIMMCYLALYAIEVVFRSKKYYLALAIVLVFPILDVALRFIIEQLFVGPVFNLWQYPETEGFKTYFFNNIFFSALGIFLCFFLKISNDFLVNERVIKEKQQYELQFLRSQINPHFLFNAFNNLYGLALTEPEKTPDVILKLADLTRYILYESNADQVQLSREVTYLKSLIELSKIRYDHETYVDFTCDVDRPDVVISPLLLIAFVENALKHGAFSQQADPLLINLKHHDQQLSFVVKNRIGHRKKDEAGGIGLRNVKRRLDLLYPAKHTLKIEQDEDYFTCWLSINLK